MTKFNSMLALVAGLSIALATSASLAQQRTIKFVVPLSPGGPNDLVARLTAEHIQRNQGVSMVIENRAGAGTVIGTEIVARAVPDGNTILMAAGSFTVKLRAIAVGTQQRIDKLPDTPSMAELGYKDFDWAGTFGVLAPAKTPKDRIDELVRWFSASLKAPEVLAKLDNLGLYPMNQCGADYSAVLSKAYEQNGRVIRESNIKAE